MATTTSSRGSSRAMSIRVRAAEARRNGPRTSTSALSSGAREMWKPFPKGDGQPDGAIRLPSARKAPQGRGGPVADGCRPSVEGEEHRETVELESSALAVCPRDILRSHEDASPQAVPTSGRAELPDRCVSVPGAARLGGGEDAVPAFGGGAQQRVHRASVAAGSVRWTGPVDDDVGQKWGEDRSAVGMPPCIPAPATARRHRGRAADARRGSRDPWNTTAAAAVKVSRKVERTPRKAAGIRLGAGTSTTTHTR